MWTRETSQINYELKKINLRHVDNATHAPTEFLTNPAPQMQPEATQTLVHPVTSNRIQDL